MPVPTSYCYDASGVLSAMQSGERRNWRFWRGTRLSNEIRLVSTATPQYVSWLVVAGKPAVELVQAEKRVLRLLAASVQGSVMLETDGEVRAVGYSPYGHRSGESASIPTAALGFNGEALDTASGCYLLGTGHHRPYSPASGMFLAPDRASPFGRGGLNPLSYCSADPINRTDPSGHFWKWVIAGVTLALGIVAVAASAGTALPALLGAAAMTKTSMVATASMTLGVVGVAAEVGAMATSDKTAASILGYVGMGLAGVGAAGGIGGAIKAATKGAVKAASKSAGSLAGKQAGFGSRASSVRSTMVSGKGIEKGGGGIAARYADTSSRVAGGKGGRFVVGQLSEARPLYADAASEAAARGRGWPRLGELAPQGRVNAQVRAHSFVRQQGMSSSSFDFTREDGLYNFYDRTLASRWDPTPFDPSAVSIPNSPPAVLRVDEHLEIAARMPAYHPGPRNVAFAPPPDYDSATLPSYQSLQDRGLL